MNQIFHHRSRVATDSTSWDYPVCTRDTLWRQHYVRTSKEYLINCHILLQYFELVFLQLQLVQILCKLIIWVNYEKNKKEFFFMIDRVYWSCGTLKYMCCSLMTVWWSQVSAVNSEGSSKAVVKLCPVQLFARDARTLLMQHRGQLAVVRFDYMYLQHFHVSLSPAAYGHPNLISLLLAVPHVIALRGKSYHQQVVSLTPRFQGLSVCFTITVTSFSEVILNFCLLNNSSRF